MANFCAGCGAQLETKADFCLECGRPTGAAQQSATVTATLTPSALLYLFADKVAPRDTAFTAGIEVPCQNVKVQAKEAAAVIFASAFWGLRERGLVQLSTVAKKKLFVLNTTGVQVTLLRQENRPGLEGAVLQQLSARPQGDVYEIIRAWFGQDVAAPDQAVASAARREAMEQGYFVQVDAQRGAIGGFLLGKMKLEPDCARIASLEGQADEVAARWRSFQTAEAPLYQALIEQSKSAIRSREEAQDTDFE